MAAFCFMLSRSRSLKSPLVLVRFDHVARVIVNADNSIG
jgi:hypothetical protein